MIGDPEIELRLGWVETAFLVVMYGFLCSASFLAIYVQGRHVDFTSLSASREELLAQTMTASEEERRRVSESISRRTPSEATFELHTSVLEEVGLGNPVDPIVFGVARELLSNVVRHSQASSASVKLAIVDGVCRLDVVDNGIGMSTEAAARRLAAGHIGLASHRARVEAAGGKFTIVDEPTGSHIRAQLRLRRSAVRGTP